MASPKDTDCHPCTRPPSRGTRGSPGDTSGRFAASDSHQHYFSAKQYFFLVIYIFGYFIAIVYVTHSCHKALHVLSRLPGRGSFSKRLPPRVIFYGTETSKNFKQSFTKFEKLQNPASQPVSQNKLGVISYFSA